ncbi:hypothetical protein PAWBP_3030 [Paulownia witches'-broom phytoplasma]|nr:hypothetical protein PAWBP_3030 [Paulownia witches'-broom phytoplasma]
MELIRVNIFVDQSKEEVINNYLIQQKIIQKPKLIKLGCYNPTPNTGLVVPFPLGGFNFLEVEAIYFDDGIRLLPQLTSTIADLLKLSNGAKNIYLFSFNTQKRIKSIELPDAIDPYQAIRTWKRDNNLFDYEGEFIHQTGSVKKALLITPNRKQTLSCEIHQLKNIFKTEKEKFIISCKDEEPKLRIFNYYSSEYVNWLNQCYIKPGISYSSVEIRDKFGRSSRGIYNQEGESCQYHYDPGFFIDDWYVNGINCVGPNNTFSNFYDTTPPLKKPQEININ